MMTYYSKLKRKLILVAVLVVVCVFILMLLTRPVSAVEYGSPLTSNEVITNDPDGRIKMRFMAEQDFVIYYHEYSSACLQYPTYRQSGPSGVFNIGSPDLHEVSGREYGPLYLLESLEYFDDNDACRTDTFLAGHTYEVYLLMIAKYKPLTPDFDTYEMALDDIANINGDDYMVDGDTTFELMEAYTDQFDVEHLYYSYVDFTPEARLNIIYPSDDTHVSSNFEMEVDYEDASGYDRLMVVFEDWNASSTCPEPTDFSYWVERSAYYDHQSMPYFSDRFTTSSGTTAFNVYGLELGNYNCNKCYFVNDSTGAMSDNLCRGFDVSVAIYVLAPDIPQFYLPFGSWPEYYAEHSEKYDTPTPLYDNLAWTFEPLINNIGNIIIFFNSYFDKQLASEKGAEFGNVVPVFRGYLDQFNDFFGGLPISELLLFYLITAILVIIYRIVRGILTILFP